MGLDEIPFTVVGDEYESAVLKSASGASISVVHYLKDFPYGPFKEGEWYVWTKETEKRDMLKPLDPLMAQCLIFHYLEQ